MKRKLLLYVMALSLTAFFVGSAQAQQKFTAALSSMQVVPANNSAGRGTCTVTLVNDLVSNLACEYSGLSNNLYGAFVEVPGAAVCATMIQGGTSGSFSLSCGSIYVTPKPNLSQLLEKRVTVTFFNYPPFTPEIQGRFKIITLDSDIDGDARMDAFLFRPSDAYSYTLCSLGDKMMTHKFDKLLNDSNPFLADFDGDGMADHSFVRTDPVTGVMSTIFIRSKDNAFGEIQWGNVNLGDQRVYGDYDRDGKIDAAVFRRTDGVWYILQSSDGQPRYEYWGLPYSDIPCPGDYDKDGKTDLCVVRPENDQLAWYIRQSSNDAFTRTLWGLPTDTIFPNYPVDVDADGANDLLVMRNESSQRVFYALRSSDNSWLVMPWGLTTDGFRLGDFDGDGKTDFAALRNINNQLVWFINQSSDGQMRVIYWGLTGDE